MIEHAALAALFIVTAVQAFQIRQLRKLIAPFDEDGDGKPGGSRKT
jgi:hypothetical protein